MNDIPSIPTSLFDYDLPPDRIAQTPAEPRDSSRLMILERANGNIHHAVFRDLPAWLRPGDTLVLNNTRVIPARLFGVKRGGGARIEVLLLEDLGSHCWRALANRARRLKTGSVIEFGEGDWAEVRQDHGDGRFDLQFHFNNTWTAFLDRHGRIPLPPYIEPDIPGRNDYTRYQTVYARDEGSSAAPTAGLHFTPELLSRCREAGVSTCEITLHVGLDTFKPVMVDDLTKHPIHSEAFAISDEAAETLNRTRSRGGRIMAIGTTSARALETAADATGRFTAGSGRTRLFILPGHEFHGLDALVTNFHLPRSTLLALVSAFSGWDNLRRAYETAIQENYRFYSYGDAMFIV